VWRPADIERALSQPRTLRERKHRPYPLPKRPWVMGQTWEDLLFAHWRVDPDALREVMPPQVEPDVWDGSAWIGVTPFAVTGMRARMTLPMPGTARFPEINVRTYTTVNDRPGIWFFSLDTPNRMAVETARRVYRLPYFRSRVNLARRDGEIDWSSERVSPDGPAAECELRYRAAGRAANPEPGSFEEFACERYCLYTLDEEERVLRGDIHHPPWPLQPAEADFAVNTMAEQVGIALEGDPILHFARRQDVVFWLNAPVGRG
jgi:uncharacterized protein